MEELTVSQLTAGTRYTGFLLVKSSDQRLNKNGQKYLDLNLADRTGEINCKVWDGTVQPPPSGKVIKVQGDVVEFNGRLQMKVLRLRYPDADDVIDMSKLVPSAPETADAMKARIEETIDAFKSEDLKKLVREMLRLAGPELDWYPAAQRMHHAERGGLLHHTTSMLSTAEHILKAYPFLNGDLLRAGVIVHDLAKINELQSDELGSVRDYTKDGLLLGHLVRGVVTLETAAANVGVSGETVELLEHMIISHHGIPEYGSPRPPMFPEAEVLHWIDTLDARLNQMQAIEDRTPPGVFSERIAGLDNRRIYHPLYDELSDDAVTVRVIPAEPDNELPY